MPTACHGSANAANLTVPQSVVSQQKFRSENAVEVEKQPRGSWRL